MSVAARTANRHRCSGREDQGVRVILRQGTRQYSDRNFGIRSAPSLCLLVTCQVFKMINYRDFETTNQSFTLEPLNYTNKYGDGAAAKEPKQLFTKNTGLC